jgi:hypothetical protein
MIALLTLLISIKENELKEKRGQFDRRRNSDCSLRMLLSRAVVFNLGYAKKLTVYVKSKKKNIIS